MEIDRIVFETASVRVGAFRCPVDHPSFRDSGPIREACFVFPRTPVVIRHRDRQPFAADPTVVTLYNRGQEYSRQTVSPQGDRCDWYAVSDALLREAVGAHDPAAADSARRPIRFPFARTSPDTYLLQRQLFARVSDGNAPDVFYVEETVMELLDRVIAAAYADPERAMRATAPRRRAASDIAHDACAFLGRRFAEPLALADVAAAVGTTSFHLCRMFRHATGTTLHAYRNQLRLRSALEQLELPGVDLSQLALALGFSSHSHFTASFRRAFGVTPSAARGRIRRIRASS